MERVWKMSNGAVVPDYGGDHTNYEASGLIINTFVHPKIR